ncbi:11600_t:CDS:2, partial [Diversispora eburnea]
MSEPKIQELLAKEQKVFVTIYQIIPGLEKFIGRSQLNNNSNGHRVELPFYLAAALDKRNLAKMERPKFLEVEIINALKVNPVNVNLHEICPQFYSFAIKYLETRHENSELVEVLVKSKRLRSLEIFDRAKRFDEDHMDFVDKLDEEERK